MGGVVDIISNLSGMKSGSTSSLLKMAAPFLMSVIGNQIKGKGLSFFTDLLMGQKDHVAKALPAGLGSVLGFADFGTSAPKVNVNMPSSSMPSTEGGNNWMKWLLPILLGAAVLYWLSTKGCGSKAVDATTDAITAVDSAAMDAANTAGAAMDSMGAAMDKLFTHTLAGGFALANASKDGIESKLITFIEDNTKVVDKTTWFDFDRLLFDTGKATLQASSQEQLINVAEIMKAFPKVHLKLGGYTDNTGDAKANLRLSTDRAFNVKNELIKLGVDKSRLEAEGFGDKFPVGDNATEEGRQQNRRISARVSQK
ncbi:MAG: OmpA family protein [Saprospiraceae bacterium]|nr:OmpA family protein [Saprospiraceae bacterium]